MVSWTILMNKMLVKAPKTIIPSRAMLTTPLRSENMPPRATTNSGIEKVRVCRKRKKIVFTEPCLPPVSSVGGR